MSEKLIDKEKSEQIRQMIHSYKSGQTLEEIGQKSNGISRERVRQIF